MLTDRSRTFLAALLDAPGPSGFESAPARRWRTEAESFADEVRADVSGNSYASLRPSGSRPDATAPVMFAGHVDEIGLMVVHIDDHGFLWFDTIGGWDPQVFVGQRVTLLARQGPVPGVIGKPAVHLLSREERDKMSKVSDLWIDIGAADKAEAARLVRVGDAGVLAAGMLDLPNGRLASRSLDNRIGAFVVLEALRHLASSRPAVPVTAVATAQEEISYSGGGARGSATGLAPLAAIVVDVTHATDTPAVEKKKAGDIALGGGVVLSRGAAVNPKVFDLLVAAADAEQIPYTLHAAPRDTGTDADAIATAHRGVATGLVSVPIRYMHSPNELVALADLHRAALLLAAFARRLTPDANLVPF